jgi:uncharacterized protein YueI
MNVQLHVLKKQKGRALNVSLKTQQHKMILATTLDHARLIVSTLHHSPPLSTTLHHSPPLSTTLTKTAEHKKNGTKSLLRHSMLSLRQSQSLTHAISCVFR